MKYLICYAIGDIEFVRLIVREYLLWIFGVKSFKTAKHNIEWFQWGGGEFEQEIMDI